MKQGKQYFTVIIWIVLAAITAYFGYSVVRSLYAPLMTVTVSEYEAGAGVYATGFVVRDEQVLSSPYESTVITCAEGAHVAAGEVLGTLYRSEEAKPRQARIAELKGQLEQLNYAWQYSTSAADQAALDGEISADLVELSRYLNRRDMNSVEDLCTEIKGLVLRRGGSEENTALLQVKIDTLQAELDTLQSLSTEDTQELRAEASGTFSAAVDGYERVLTPERLQTLSSLDFDAIAPQTPDEHAIGKLISGDTWYFVCVVPADQLRQSAEGDPVKLTFSRDFYQTADMQIARLGENEAGNRLLVLSCDSYLERVTLLRRQSAELVFDSHAGLRVPKDAVRVDENGRTGVYILEGSLARWKQIEILHDMGESYIVTLDKSSTANLWPGDELIINAKDLYDGKVVG